MTAGLYDITIEAGATFRLAITWKDDAGVAINLTGYSARMQVRETYEATDTATDPILSLTSGAGDIVLGGSAGTVVVTVPAATTQKLFHSYAVYDLELEASNGVVTRLLQGNAIISREVTR